MCLSAAFRQCLKSCSFLLLLLFAGCSLLVAQKKIIASFGGGRPVLYQVKNMQRYLRAPADSSNLVRIDPWMHPPLSQDTWFTGWLRIDSSLTGSIAAWRVSCGKNNCQVFFDTTRVFNANEQHANVRAAYETRAAGGMAIRISHPLKTGQYKNLVFYRTIKSPVRLLIFYQPVHEEAFTFSISPLDFRSFIIAADQNEKENALLLAASTVLAVFFILFTLIFLFNRKEKFNIWFALFCLSIGFIIYYSSQIKSTGALIEIVVTLAISLLEVSFFLFLNQYLFSKIPRITKVFLWTIAGGTAACIAVLLTGADKPAPMQAVGILYLLNLLMAVTESFRCIISGLIKKIRAARVAALGFLISFGIFASVLLSLFFNDGLNADNHSVFLLSLSSVTFPLLMGINLAISFANKSKKLLEQLGTIQELNEQNMKKEKEKQEIILRQKENLEVQVRERTAEIVKQKEETELKQKEILDSIQYARRIQKALITSEWYVERQLKRLARRAV